MTRTLATEQDAPGLALADLRATVRIIRPYNPVLALSVQNRIVQSLKPELLGRTASNSMSGIHTQTSNLEGVALSLDPFTHQRIIETLAEIGGELAQDALVAVPSDSQSLDDILNLLTLWLGATRARLGIPGRKSQ